jgi:hypothetical protein
LPVVYDAPRFPAGLAELLAAMTHLHRTAERSLEGMLAKSLDANCDPAGTG